MALRNRDRELEKLAGLLAALQAQLEPSYEGPYVTCGPTPEFEGTITADLVRQWVSQGICAKPYQNGRGDTVLLFHYPEYETTEDWLKAVREKQGLPAESTDLAPIIAGSQQEPQTLREAVGDELETIARDTLATVETARQVVTEVNAAVQTYLGNPHGADIEAHVSKLREMDARIGTQEAVIADNTPAEQPIKRSGLIGKLLRSGMVVGY